jgi:hypothetical protein
VPFIEFIKDDSRVFELQPQLALICHNIKNDPCSATTVDQQRSHASDSSGGGSTHERSILHTS